jgi:nicotinamidase/pyrazinamidase
MLWITSRVGAAAWPVCSCAIRHHPYEAVRIESRAPVYRSSGVQQIPRSATILDSTYRILEVEFRFRFRHNPGEGMRSPDTILWCVDAQKDFMQPGGKLYVPGAEKLLPNIDRLVDAVRGGSAFLVSHGCFHTVDDAEFSTFPPHCIKGTPGAEFVPEAMTRQHVRVPNDPGSSLPKDFLKNQQIILEKQTLDIFESRHANALLERLDRNAEFIVFGVVTEYCVRLAAKGLMERGRRVSVVRDAIETLSHETGERTVSELRTLGANFVTTNEALARFTVGTEKIL